MDVATLETLSRLIDEALERAPEDQESWLESLGPEYTALRPTLARLLRAHASLSATSFLRTLPKLGDTDAGEADASGGANARAGETFGPYRIVRELAAGGMGSVWLAERTDGLVKRPVALKLPRGAWRRMGLAERMAREREILASLAHPNIARLYDAGIAPDGQPFLALEYVDGRPLDQYCREAQLGVEARLSLFQQVVSAVAHAHSRLVVHRDLKPSNILVTPEGHVRLLDFGIAKLLEPTDPDEASLTEISGRALTPDYASPEQITGAAITTASDIYSLGVVLFELLTGARPYTLKRASPGALEDAIVELEPARPSQSAPDRALARRLRGDLDWIVAKAMAKAPDHRYQSAAALAADIDRHLRQEPVEAAAPGAAYRMGRFARRHRVGLAAAGVIVIALVAGVVGTTAGLVRARGAEAEARAAAETARTEAETADRVTRFMLDLFDATTPEQGQGRDVTARQVLDRGAARVRSELAGEPLVQARLLQSLANAYSSLGLYPEARPLVEEAVAAARSLGERGDRELSQALLTLGQLRRRLDDAAGAESAVREALAIKERISGGDNADLGVALNELAMLLRTREPDEAVRLYRRAYDLLVATHGRETGDAGTVLANIGAIQTRTRHYSDARENLTRALALVTTNYGEQDPRVAGVAGNLAVVERELGRPRRAIELHMTDLELSSKALGPEHPVIGTIWMNLARSTQRTGDYAAALAQIETGLAIMRKHFVPNHALIVTSENSRALYLIARGRSADAAAILGNLLELTPTSHEAKTALLVSRLQLADIERRSGRFERALALTRMVMDDPIVEPDPKLLADAHWARACTLAAQGALDEAATVRGRAIEVQGADPQATAGERSYAQAKYAACADDREGALTSLKEAVAHGFDNPVVLADPTFAAVRALPAFDTIASAVTRHAKTGLPADRR